MSERYRTKRIPVEIFESISAKEGNETQYENSSPRARLCMEILRDVFENGLTKKQKCYIILYYRDNLTMEEIAGRYSVNKSTVSRTVNAARRKINSRIERFIDIRI